VAMHGWQRAGVVIVWETWPLERHFLVVVISGA